MKNNEHRQGNKTTNENQDLKSKNQLQTNESQSAQNDGFRYDYDDVSDVY